MASVISWLARSRRASRSIPRAPTWQIVSEGDEVWVYGTYFGTHMGDGLGNPGTGKAHKFDADDISRVEDGNLAEHCDVLYLYTLFKQLGVIK